MCLSRVSRTCRTVAIVGCPGRGATSEAKALTRHSRGNGWKIIQPGFWLQPSVCPKPRVCVGCSGVHTQPQTSPGSQFPALPTHKGKADFTNSTGFVQKPLFFAFISQNWVAAAGIKPALYRDQVKKWAQGLFIEKQKRAQDPGPRQDQH